MFSRFDKIPACDGQTDGRMTTAYTSRGKTVEQNTHNLTSGFMADQTRHARAMRYSPPTSTTIGMTSTHIQPSRHYVE